MWTSVRNMGFVPCKMRCVLGHVRPNPFGLGSGSWWVLVVSDFVDVVTMIADVWLLTTVPQTHTYQGVDTVLWRMLLSGYSMTLEFVRWGMEASRSTAVHDGGHGMRESDEADTKGTDGRQVDHCDG